MCMYAFAHAFSSRTMDNSRRKRFGRYEVLGELGRGAMGIVYKARDPKINRIVAVKTISLAGQSPEDEREFRERFVREAEAAGRLSHPGIVTIYDVGEEPGTHAPYIVMEYVSGCSLEKQLSGANSTLSVEAALQLTLELAEALDCAHGQGVIHRDLKPSNILMTEEGHAKIADFGIAKLNLANLTLTGRTLGTPAFMSPEQLSGEGVDGRSDLFSVGVILYTALTGFRPFQGNSALTVSFKVVNRDPIPPTVLDTDLPAGVDYIVSRAMAKDPAQRYQRGMELVLDIQELRAGREPWSKTKQPFSTSFGKTVQAANLHIKKHPTPEAIAKLSFAKSIPWLRPLIASPWTSKMLRGSVVTAAVLMLGLAVLGIGLSRTFVHSAPAWPMNSAKIAAKTAPVQGLRPVVPSVASNDGAPTLRVPEAAPAPAKTSKASATAPPATNKRTGSGDSSAVAKAAARHASAPTGVAAAPSVEPTTLEIDVNHKFSEAKLSIWVDDRLTYTHSLEGSEKQHLVVFHRAKNHEFHAMQIPAGNHHLKVRITSDEKSFDQSSTIAGNFPTGKETLLHVSISKQGEIQLTLE